MKGVSEMARKIKLTKQALRKLVKQNKSSRFIAHYFHVSERTLYRRIKKWNLKGIRPKGRKPIRIVEPIPIPKGWVTSASYIKKLDKQYHFRNITYLPTRYVNTDTRVCSNRKRNPKRKFAVCTVYYVAFESQLYFLYPLQIIYSRKPVSFNEIYHFISNRAYDLLNTKLKASGIEVIEVVALHFYIIKKRSVLKGQVLLNSDTITKNLNHRPRGGKHE